MPRKRGAGLVLAVILGESPGRLFGCLPLADTGLRIKPGEMGQGTRHWRGGEHIERLARGAPSVPRDISPREGDWLPTYPTNPTFLWLPSQNGLLAEWPQRHRKTFVVRSTVWPVPVTISTLPSSLSGPFVVGIARSGPSRTSSAGVS